MQVYVLEQWFDQYEFLGVLGVFSSRQAAEDFARMYEDEHSGDYLYYVSESRLDSGEVQESVRLFR